MDGIRLTSNLKNIDAIRREVGMVFQHFNLFPHLTILKTVPWLPIWVRKMPKDEAEETAMAFLERVKIPDQANKYPGHCPAGNNNALLLRARYV